MVDQVLPLTSRAQISVFENERFAFLEPQVI